jgi:hypothetical protein
MIRSEDGGSSSQRCSSHLPGLGLPLVAAGCGRIWALDRGKPLADGGGRDVDDADGAVLLPEGDIEVISPPCPIHLG